MRTHARALLLVVAALLLFGCSGESDVTSSAASSTTTTTAAPTTITEGTEAPPPPDTAAPGTTAAKPPPSFPKPKPSVTTAPSKPKPTFPPKSTTTKKPLSPFCQYLADVDLNLGGTDFQSGFTALHEAVNNALPIAPPEIAQAVADLKAGLDALQPSVDAGDVRSTEDLNVWLKQQDPATRVRIATAMQAVGTYNKENCT